MEHDPATLTDSQVLARVRARRMAAHEAEVEILLLAAAWADAHPASDDDPEPYAAGDTIPSNVDEARVPVPGIPAWRGMRRRCSRQPTGSPPTPGGS